jgi:hypothetical protein
MSTGKMTADYATMNATLSYMAEFAKLRHEDGTFDKSKYDEIVNWLADQETVLTVNGTDLRG